MDKKKPISINTIIRVITLRRVRTSQNPVPRVHLRLISLICVSSDHTSNIWRWDIDRGAAGRGGKRWDSSWWTHGSVGLWREVPDGRVIYVRNVVIHDGRRWWSWSPDSRTIRAVHNDNRFWVPSRPQELSYHISSGDQTTNYDRFDRRFDSTTDRDSIDEHSIIRVSS
jgi:hypothetical protein